jgi:APA family basic amino acid/polyamine antiporter
VLVILALTAINYVGVKAGSRLQTVLTAAKLLAIGVIVVVGSIAAAGSETIAAMPARSGTLSDFLLAMVAGLFAYGGWHMVTYTAGETQAPAKTIPIALVAGVATVTAAYIALNLVYLAILPIDTVRTSRTVAADAANAVVGRGGSAFMAGLVMMSSLGALTGIVLAGPRVYYSMAVDGLAFRWVAYIHPVYRTPSRAIVAQGVWSAVLAATGAYQALFTRVIYTEWLFFAAMAAGLFVLRRRPDYKPAYRTWGYPVVPLVFITASLAVVANQIYRQPYESAAGLGLVAIGIPIYYLAHARR